MLQPRVAARPGPRRYPSRRPRKPLRKHFPRAVTSPLTSHQQSHPLALRPPPSLGLSPRREVAKPATSSSLLLPLGRRLRAVARRAELRNQVGLCAAERGRLALEARAGDRGRCRGGGEVLADGGAAGAAGRGERESRGGRGLEVGAEPAARGARGLVVSAVWQHRGGRERERGRARRERKEKRNARRPIFRPLLPPPLPLTPPLPLLLFPPQPLLQPLLVLVERVPKHLDVEEDDGLEGPVGRRVGRDALELGEDVLAADETAKDGVLAWLF